MLPMPLMTLRNWLINRIYELQHADDEYIRTVFYCFEWLCRKPQHRNNGTGERKKCANEEKKASDTRENIKNYLIIKLKIIKFQRRHSSFFSYESMYNRKNIVSCERTSSQILWLQSNLRNHGAAKCNCYALKRCHKNESDEIFNALKWAVVCNTSFRVVCVHFFLCVFASSARFHRFHRWHFFGVVISIKMSMGPTWIDDLTTSDSYALGSKPQRTFPCKSIFIADFN